MHRRALLDLLRAYRAGAADDRRACERTIAFVEAHADCFERSLAEGHITGATWIVDRVREHCLLTHHAKLDMWLQLGGHADGDADVVSVALREAHEESGLTRLRLLDDGVFDVDVHSIPARRDEPHHFHYDIRFLVEADRTEPLVVSSESKDLAWVALDRVTTLGVDRSITRMVDKTPTRWG